MGSVAVAHARLSALGPSLARLAEVAEPAGPPIGVAPLRVALLTEVLELAAAARHREGAGDVAAARAALDTAAWQAAWDRASEQLAERTCAHVDARLVSALRAAHHPFWRRRGVRLNAAERRVLRGRLAAPGDALATALAGVASASEAEWADAVLRAARATETGWLAAEAAAVEEALLWEREVARIVAWRRPRWPVVLIGGLLLAAAGWAGLAIGGYIPVPAWFLPAAEWAWNTGWL